MPLEGKAGRPINCCCGHRNGGATSLWCMLAAGISRKKTVDSAQGEDIKLESIFDNQKRISLISYSQKNDITENMTLNLILQVAVTSWIHSLAGPLIWNIGCWSGRSGTLRIAEGTFGWTSANLRLLNWGTKWVYDWAFHWYSSQPSFACKIIFSISARHPCLAMYIVAPNRTTSALRTSKEIDSNLRIALQSHLSPQWASDPTTRKGTSF